jgi:hypothetical protein
VAPQWYPAGLETAELTATPRNTGVTIRANYETTGKSISVAIRQYVSAEDASIGIGSFEKDAADVTKYECNGIIHYILSNNFSHVAAWTNDTLVCSILGDVTVDELKQMINSIYEG